ncbi:MAG TPA: DUF4142 domain-containing protein [Rhodanobacter sp.]
MLLLSLTGTALAQSGSGSAKNTTNATDSAFMRNAAAGGMAEVQMGQMALDKSSDAQVKQLAQRIVDDHTKANDQLKTLAESKHVSLPATAAAAAQKEGKSLMAMNGTAFDHAWSKAMVKDHQKAVKLFSQESKQAKDSDVRQFAQGTLPTLNTHLQMAQGLLAVPDARDKAMDQATKSMADKSMMGDNAHAPTLATPAATAPQSHPAPPPTVKH